MDSMITKKVFLKQAKDELGEIEFSHLFVGLDNDYYAMVEERMKKGEKISVDVYDSLSDGQKFHFNKHYNFRGDKTQKTSPLCH